MIDRCQDVNRKKHTEQDGKVEVDRQEHEGSSERSAPPEAIPPEPRIAPGWSLPKP